MIGVPVPAPACVVTVIMLTGLRAFLPCLPAELTATAAAAATTASVGGTKLFPRDSRAGDMPTNPSATPRVPAKARILAIIFTGASRRSQRCLLVHSRYAVSLIRTRQIPQSCKYIEACFAGDGWENIADKYLAVPAGWHKLYRCSRRPALTMAHFEDCKFFLRGTCANGELHAARC